jgi:hypothetical protein
MIVRPLPDELYTALGRSQKRDAPKVRLNDRFEPAHKIDRTVLQLRALLSRAFSATPLFGSIA